LDGMESPLRERREGPDRLDLVAEELDSQRLPACGREDVDQPAAHGELTALLDPLDAFVAGERDTLEKQVDSPLLPLGDRDTLAPPPLGPPRAARAPRLAAACPLRARSRKRRRPRRERARRAPAPARRRGAA